MSEAKTLGGVVVDKIEYNESLNPLIGALQRGHYLLYCQSIERIAPQAKQERPYQEILIRFLEEERRLLPPGLFFPILQEQGLMSLLDCWVVSQVLKLQQVGINSQPGWNPPRNSINLSEDSVIDPEFIDFVVTQLEKWNPSADTLSFEVLESVALSDTAAFEEMIAALSPRGCSFAIGSFTGAAEDMDLLDHLRVDIVKIDGGLIRKVLVSPTDHARVKQINDRCHERGIKTVAEFVEHEDTLAALRKIGVDYAQGFGISEPVPFLAG